MNTNGGCLLRIREAIHALSPKEVRLATYILSKPDAAVNQPIDRLAANSGVSASTVNRFCKSLHYNGYKEFSRGLYSDMASPQDASGFEDIHPGDDAALVMRNICLSSIKAIENTVAITDIADLTAAVDALCCAKRIDFYGMGASGLVAQDACSKFLHCGKTAIAYTSPHEQILAALSLDQDDVAVMISYSGETTDILNLARDVKKIGAKLISLTRYGKNPLSELADICLFSSSTETLLRSGAMSSRIAQLMVIDTLYAAVCSRDFNNVKQHLEMTRKAVKRLRAAPY